ncbi:MAG: tetratricopeptide repeat protein [Planctomycetes bacterium]|jgi:tetratricopeptide (TPR) repeat protein|nr:tetratricopeptide repeat protein [Planctomycetota bacterium]
MKTLQSIAIVLLLAAVPASVLAQDETIDREYGDVLRFFDDDGKPQKMERIRVDEATYDKVKYTLRGGKTAQEKEGARVDDLIYGDAPKVFLDGLRNLRNEQWAAAISDFDGAKNAVDAGRARPWLLEAAALRKGQALLALGQQETSRLAEALSAFEEALKANPKSLWFKEIRGGIADVCILQKNWDGARTAAEAIQKTGETIKNPLWQVRGARLLATILMAEGKNAEAVTAFDNVVALAQRELRFAKPAKWQKELRAAEIDAVVEQGWARVAWAESSGAKQDWDRAKDYFSGLPAKYPQEDQVKAAVLNGLGRCLLDDKPRDALLSFTEAEVTCFSARREVARALWLKSLALAKLGGDWNKRLAEQAKKELRQYYPETEWARK